MTTASDVGAAWTITSRQVTPHRVEAEVDGVSVWAESDDVPLADGPEAWGTAFALPSARAHAALRFTKPIDMRWAVSSQHNIELATGWWGGDAFTPWSTPASRIPGPLRRWLRRPAAGRALCFTGGVDSFFSLLGDAHHPTHLLYVVGFDVPVDDQARVDDVTQLVRSVAAARELVPIIVRTDLRDHPHFASISWEHTHGAALAAIGHLISSTVSTLVIPPSYAADRLVPWGSHPDLDPGWGIPRRLTIEHGDASGRRLDRVQAIARDPLVHRHLRVCWQNVGTDRNCGRCEKCVRTMAMLAGAGVLDQCVTFPARSELPARIDGLGTVPTGIVPLWEDLLGIELLAAERTAIGALLERSSAA